MLEPAVQGKLGEQGGKADGQQVKNDRQCGVGESAEQDLRKLLRCHQPLPAVQGKHEQHRGHQTGCAVQRQPSHIETSHRQGSNGEEQDGKQDVPGLSPYLRLVVHQIRLGTGGPQIAAVLHAFLSFFQSEGGGQFP